MMFMALAAVVLCGSFASCSKDDDDVIPAEDDKEVRDLVFNLLHMDGDISDMQIQRMVIERFGSKYAGMSLNDWRHIIESYTSMVREALNSKAKEVVLQLKKAAEPEPLNLKK